MYVLMCACTYVCTVPDTSYLRGSEVFCSFSAQVSVKFREDICCATAPLPRTTRADSVEGFATGLRTSDCVHSRRFEIVGKFVRILETQLVEDDF